MKTGVRKFKTTLSRHHSRKTHSSAGKRAGIYQLASTNMAPAIFAPLKCSPASWLVTMCNLNEAILSTDCSMKHLHAHPLAVLVLPLLLCPTAALASLHAEIGGSNFYLLALYVLAPPAIGILFIGWAIWKIIGLFAEDKGQDDLTHVAEDDPDGYGRCPNCNGTVLLTATNCQKCGANFGSGSAWRVKNSQYSKSEKLVDREN